MKARSGALVMGAVVLAAVPLMGQSRGARTTVPRRVAPSVTPAPAPQPEVAPPSPSPARGAGAMTPPNQGYVVMPDRPPAGTAAGSAVPSDPLDRAYWELYDRQKPITLTGKVTKVDWANPNSYIFMAAESGLWVVESGFIQFRQSSITPAIRVDEIITVTGYLPKEEPGGELPAKRSATMANFLKTNHLIRAGEITTVFGQKLTMGRPPSEAEMAERLKCSAFGC